MEDRLRDLEQIQERDVDESARRVGLVVLASVAVVAVIFSLGVVVGRAANPDHDTEDDPLARIESLNQVNSERKNEIFEPSRVRAEELSFPSVLTQKQDLPEVSAAVAAAAAEEASLNAKLAELSSDANTGMVPAVPALDPPTITKVVSGSLAVQPSAKSPRTNVIKPVTGPSIPQRVEREIASVGQEGEYNLQVISYERREPANAFAKGLRARGHRAYVLGVDVPERGTYWRVRIGPFDSKWEADQYRRKFEQEERMNVIVVKKQKQR